MKGPIRIEIVPHNSNQYWKVVELRDKLLRKPLGLKFSKEELLNENNQIHIAAYGDNNLVGCLSLVPNNSRKIKMRQVCVNENAQGKGVGRVMVAACEEYAKKNGYSLMYCNARDIAVPFYLSLGYRKVGNLFTEVGIDHWKMEKELN